MVTGSRALLVARIPGVRGTATTETHCDLERIQTHVATDLPLAALFGVEVVAAEPSLARQAHGEPEHRPPWRSGCWTLPPFAMADITTYAPTLVQPRPLLA